MSAKAIRYPSPGFRVDKNSAWGRYPRKTPDDRSVKPVT
ncbi:hypothetical protein X474_00850 [Dethiosulfatarculus sandiegensis]|uniref:Uncharacterized protein n=1 Tax=Dethiosulfatarculus sandiegensis TaxID=1429043 RepID=A0A0D2JKA6_9BACT|nr:hypothetical protein X474_00850 [Dethiosulfatarculus sandiegensis]